MLWMATCIETKPSSLPLAHISIHYAHYVTLCQNKCSWLAM